MRRILIVALALAAGCKTGGEDKPAARPTPAAVDLPAAPPIPQGAAILGAVADPKENPTTAEKVELGWTLFFEKRLSKDDSMACAECHHVDKSYTDGRAVSPKVGGGMNKRNAPTMVNLGYHAKGYYWDGRMPTLEAVSAAAWKGQLGADPAAVATKLNGVPEIRARFQRAFGAEATADNVPMALASFFRALKTADAPFDRYEKGDKTAVSKDAIAGFEVFRNKGCAQCHVPPLYTDNDFHNAGIGMNAPDDKRDKGRTDATKSDDDEGKFKTPTLRNVTLTAPYFHDGSVKTLDDALDVMIAGGKKHKKLDPKLKAQKLTAKERSQLKAFLQALEGPVTHVAPGAEPMTTGAETAPGSHPMTMGTGAQK